MVPIAYPSATRSIVRNGRMTNSRNDLLHRPVGRRRWFRRAVAAAVAACHLPLVAQAQTVTLAEAAERMQVTELQYEILDLEEAVAAEVTRQALGERLPRVRLSVSYIQTQQNIVSQDNQTFQEGQSTYPTINVTLAATQPVWDPVRFRALPLARAEQELVSLQAEEARIELTNLLLAAFLNVARAQLEVDQAQLLVRARTQLSRDLGVLVSAGRADADRQLRAEGDVFAARADLADAEAALTEALFELRRFAGPEVEGVDYRFGVGVADLRAFLAEFTPERLEELNPAIQVARAELAVAESRLRRVRGSYQPTANLTLEVENERTEGSLFGGGSEVQSAELGLQVDWAVYEGGVRRSQVREAQRRVEIAELRLQQSQDLAERRYQALVGALERSLEMVGANAQDRRVAAERAVVAQRQVEMGRGALEQVLEAQLRRDTLTLRGEAMRLRAVALQAELYALFGALDIETLSQDFAG